MAVIQHQQHFFRIDPVLLSPFFMLNQKIPSELKSDTFSRSYRTEDIEHEILRRIFGVGYGGGPVPLSRFSYIRKMG